MARPLKPWQTGLWALLFTLPVWSSLLGRLVKGKWWFNDFDALICGADHLRRGLSPYSLTPVCEGLKPAPYVYAPQVGEVLAPLTLMGFDALKAVYAVILIALLAFTAWYVLIKKWPRVPLIWRLLGFGLLTGSSIASGNIGLVLHAVILITALGVHRTPLPFVAAVVLAATVKPFMLTYLIVLMLVDRPFWQRLVVTLGSAVAGVALVAGLLATARFATEWQALRDSVVAAEQTGISWFGWMSALGFETYALTSLAGLLLYLIIVGVCGLILTELSQPNDEERVALGLTLGLLLNPRLMDYDLLLLPLGMALILCLSRPLGDKVFGAMRRAFIAVASVALILRMADIEGLAPDKFITLFYICGLIATTALWIINDPSAARRQFHTLFRS